MTDEVQAQEEPTNLLDMSGADETHPEPVTQNQPQAIESHSEWSWDEGIKGDGDKPEWLNGRYKSVSDQAKAYTELEKRFGEFKGAPKDGYNFDAIESLDKDSPMLQQFSKTFAELNLSQSGFERIVSEFVNSHADIAQANASAEMKKLGPQGQTMIKETNTWIQNTFPPEVGKIIQSWVMTADDIKALDTIRAFQPTSRIPGNHMMQNSAVYESLSEVKGEKVNNWTKYQEDSNFRRSIDNRMASAQRREKTRK